METALRWLALLAALIYSPSAPTTVQSLKADHSLSNAFTEQGNAECNLSTLCSYEEMNVEPMCGTDGRTYNSFCEIKRTVCHGNPVRKHLDGPCPETIRCGLEREFQLRLAAERINATEIFVPECNATDGSYAIVQCHKGTGYCWCATRLGRPLPSTSVRNSRPDCRHVYATKVGRRSHRKSSGEEEHSEVCTTFDRSTFNANLYELFKTEYERGADPATADTSLALDKRIILWKFGELDKNGNGRLSYKEIGGLKRLVRKLVAPKACARRFSWYCDLDKDSQICSREWITCLAVDLSTSFGMFNSLRPSTNKPDPRFAKSVPPFTLRPNRATRLRAGNNVISLATGFSLTNGKLDELMPTNRSDEEYQLNSLNEAKEENLDDEHLDCRTQRQRVMEKLKNNPENGNYVPVCTGSNDLLYDAIQCHRLSQYCWCVNSVTGAPVLGTSKYNAKPNCDSNDANSSNGGPPREIKGCTGKKRAKFFQRLFSSLISEWITAVGDDTADESITSKDKAVRWKFAQLDLNHNNRLERKEWKPYRNELKQINKIRKCGRNFMRFCDRDGDKRITLDEWLNCVINVDTSLPMPKPKITLPRKNPFLDILKPED